MTDILSRTKEHFEIWVLLLLFLLVGREVVLGLQSVTLIIPSQGSIECGATEATALYVDGRHIRRVSDDSIIYLRGVHIWGPLEDGPYGNWLGSDGNMHWNEYSTSMIEDNLDAMLTWNINTIRIHCCVAHWMNNASGYIPRIKEIIDLAGDRGMYVVVDWYNILGWSDPPWKGLPVPPYLSESELAYISSVQDFVDFQVDVATELRYKPNVILDIWNEPHKWHGITEEEAMNDWFDVVQLCIPAIRAVTDHIITVAWWWGVDVDMNNPEGYCHDMSWINDTRIQGSNIIYQTHIYEDSYGFYVEGRYGQTKEEIRQAFEYELIPDAVEDNVLFIGEWGRDRFDSGASECFRNAGELLHEYGIHYTAFAWEGGSRAGDEYALLVEGANFPPHEHGQILIDLLAGASL